jgi:hypothetical protein
VGRAVDADRIEIEEIRRRYLAAAMVLAGLRIERNGNGRDYDVIPSFEGAHGHGYRLFPLRERTRSVTREIRF